MRSSNWFDACSNIINAIPRGIHNFYNKFTTFDLKLREKPARELPTILLSVAIGAQKSNRALRQAERLRI
jgi:hypothetical protein